MKLNENITVVGNKVMLVPYTKDHVEKYNNWMKSTELLQQTASEPLSIDEEYSMQEQWWADNDKCTFIILSRKSFEENNSADNEINAMVGDVNLFFNNPDCKFEAELELMIAEKSSRGKGYGKESAKLMMYFGTKFLNVKKYVVKIGVSNSTSISLFTKLGFQLESHSEVFQETTFSLDCSSKVYLNCIVEEVDSYFKTKVYKV